MDIDLKNLKRRMGWTSTDLARRLGVNHEEIEIWESGQSSPSSDQLSRIEFLFRQARICSNEVKTAPIAENEMEQTHLDQLRADNVKQ
jgi:transcriptional regulator with XRE-family HTH domain